MANWFEKLTGFTEQSPEFVRQQLLLDKKQLTSKANGRSFQYGQLSIPSLAKLRQDTITLSGNERSLQIREVIGDVDQRCDLKEPRAVQ